jgi:hypothetical protein
MNKKIKKQTKKQKNSIPIIVSCRKYGLRRGRKTGGVVVESAARPVENIRDLYESETAKFKSGQDSIYNLFNKPKLAPIVEELEMDEIDPKAFSLAKLKKDESVYEQPKVIKPKVVSNDQLISDYNTWKASPDVNKNIFAEPKKLLESFIDEVPLTSTEANNMRLKNRLEALNIKKSKNETIPLQNITPQTTPYIDVLMQGFEPKKQSRGPTIAQLPRTSNIEPIPFVDNLLADWSTNPPRRQNRNKPAPVFRIPPQKIEPNNNMTTSFTVPDYSRHARRMTKHKPIRPYLPKNIEEIRNPFAIPKEIRPVARRFMRGKRMILPPNKKDNKE